MAGTVLKADGSPVPEGWVNANRIPAKGEQGGQASASGALVDGKFELVGLTPGKYRVYVSGQDLPSKQVIAEAGDEAVRIQYGQGGAVEGRVLKPDGGPAVGAWVSASSPEGNGWSQVGPDGRYSVKELPAGTYSVTSGFNLPDGKSLSGIAGGIAVAVGSSAAVPDITLEENP